MKRKITIMNANMTNNKVLLEVNETINGLIPAEQVLVDSEHYTFVYLMEDHDDYTYIVLPEQTWAHLETARAKGIPVMLSNPDKEIELTNFNEELEYLISNIQGNTNYGEEMVTKVERVFHT